MQRAFQEWFSRPHLKLVVRSAVLWGLGDVGAQAVTHYSAQQSSGVHFRIKIRSQFQDKYQEPISFGKKGKEFKIDRYRVCQASVFGLGFGCSIGPAAYYWFSKSMRRSMATASDAVVRLVLDGLFGTLSLAMFFPIMGSMEGRTSSLEQAKEDVKRGFRPALVLGGAALPATTLANWRFVPVRYQLHCASLFALVGSGSLSWIELQQQRARKKMEVSVVQKQESNV